MSNQPIDPVIQAATNAIVKQMLQDELAALQNRILILQARIDQINAKLALL